MRAPVTFHGLSGDRLVIETENDTAGRGEDEIYYCHNDKARVRLVAPDGTELLVMGQIERHGCWAIALAQVDRDTAMPP